MPPSPLFFSHTQPSTIRGEGEWKEKRVGEAAATVEGGLAQDACFGGGEHLPRPSFFSPVCPTILSGSPSSSCVASSTLHLSSLVVSGGRGQKISAICRLTKNGGGGGGNRGEGEEGSDVARDYGGGEQSFLKVGTQYSTAQYSSAGTFQGKIHESCSIFDFKPGEVLSSSPVKP